MTIAADHIEIAKELERKADEAQQLSTMPAGAGIESTLIDQARQLRAKAAEHRQLAGLTPVSGGPTRAQRSVDDLLDEAEKLRRQADELSEWNNLAATKDLRRRAAELDATAAAITPADEDVEKKAAIDAMPRDQFWDEFARRSAPIAPAEETPQQRFRRIFTEVTGRMPSGNDDVDRKSVTEAEFHKIFAQL